MRKQRKSHSNALNRIGYSVDLSLKGTSFGLGKRSSVLSERGKDSPSPLKYYPSKTDSPYKGVSLKGICSDVKIVQRLQSLPGPGSYDPYEPLGVSAVKYTMKPRIPLNPVSCTPAPSSYFPKHHTVLRNNPIYSIPSGIRSKSIHEKVPVNPGPGSYDLKQ
jgi:hypothetical protein